LLAIVRDVHAGGVTVVWIEHVVLALRRLASRIDVLNGGRFIASGPPDEVLADPRVREVYLGV
jgi:branched-chain amino acid transport system ATP-binding protein